jgi:isoleucyl-tRNA synthetase
MLQTWQPLPKPADEGELLDKWRKIALPRRRHRALEELRIEAGKIGSSLQAEVNPCRRRKVRDPGLAGRRPALRLHLLEDRAVRSDEEKLECTRSTHAKCERCWHVREDVGANAEHPELCGRCVSNLHGEGEARACA